MKKHTYKLSLNWVGNLGSGTSDYRAYSRNHVIQAESKSEILASSDPAFRGDSTRYNPEVLLLASLSSCHMLWFLHLCADSGVIVVQYFDNPEGIMLESENGAGRFESVTLNPIVTVAESSMLDKLDPIHEKANSLCFIANSVNFPVKHNPTCKVPN
ncbi:MAG: peroxiredoxin [Ignavibacteriae bacterium HGW-Ignavibacteriae-1]|jgi:organic hydroperoxide reductase OsmC/OhrA|nr:MAG: peroxiredoxin [Ignavibacteriae bacterium HGW-Ignavibacteriae-1]